MADASTGDGGSQQLLIFIGEQDRWHGRPLYLAILELVRAQGGAGATVLQGVAGYSAGGRLIQAGAPGGAEANRPLAVVVVDRAAQIAALLPALDAMVAAEGGVIAVSDLAVYRAYHPERRASGAPQKVAQMMETQVVSVAPETPVAELLPLLLNKPYKALPVVDAERHVLGMVTDGDLLRASGLGLPLNVLEAVQARGAAGYSEVMQAVRASGKTARDVMGVRPEAVIGPDATVDAAARLMVQQHVKRLPVVDDERRLLGIVGRLDVLTAASRVSPAPQAIQPPPPGAQTLQDVLLPDVPIVLLDTPVPAVLDALVGSRGVRRVVVIDDPTGRHVVGIITAADLVRRSAPPEQPGLMHMLFEGLQLFSAGMGATPLLPTTALETARRVMSAPAITAPATMPIGEAITLMVRRGVKALPVVDESGRLVGLVNRQRLLQALIGGEGAS